MRKRIAVCEFYEGGKGYAYITYDDSIEVGDEALVYSRDQYQIVNVTEIYEDGTNEDMATAYIQSKVDRTAWNKGLEMERRVNEIKNKIRRRFSELEEESRWRLIADRDAELSSLINEMDSIRGGKA